MATKDPAVSTWFGIEFQGKIVGAFRECSGLGSENEIVEEKASGPKDEPIMKKIPGRMKWGDITLKRGKTDISVEQIFELFPELRGRIDRLFGDGNSSRYHEYHRGTRKPDCTQEHILDIRWAGEPVHGASPCTGTKSAQLIAAARTPSVIRRARCSC